MTSYAGRFAGRTAIVTGGGNTLAANPEQRAPDLTIVVLMPEGMPATGLADDPYAEPAEQLAAVAFDGVRVEDGRAAAQDRDAGIGEQPFAGRIDGGVFANAGENVL